jgi:hypothetical protein
LCRRAPAQALRAVHDGLQAGERAVAIRKIGGRGGCLLEHADEAVDERVVKGTEVDREGGSALDVAELKLKYPMGVGGGFAVGANGTASVAKPQRAVAKRVRIHARLNCLEVGCKSGLTAKARLDEMPVICGETPKVAEKAEESRRRQRGELALNVGPRLVGRSLGRWLGCHRRFLWRLTAYEFSGNNRANARSLSAATRG